MKRLSQDYWDWSELSGIYIKNVSHLERYETYQKVLSPPGLNVVIAFDFLRENRTGIDLNHWRLFSVYDSGANARKRVQLTVAALQAIGAHRLAAKLPTVNKSSPLDLVEEMSLLQGMSGLADEAEIVSPTPNVDADTESYEHVEALLEQYAREHETALLADIAKQGDPRSEQGFSRKARMHELDDMRQRYYEVEDQKEAAAKIRQYVVQLEQKAAAGVPAPTLSSLRKKLLNLLKQCRRSPEAERISDLAQALEQAAAFQQQHATLFPHEATALPEELRARLERLGQCEMEPSAARYRWELAVPLQCDWTSFSLSLSYPKKKPQQLVTLLDAVDYLIEHGDTIVGQWREEVLEHFRCVEDQLDEFELEDYELDAEGQATNESILANAGSGQLAISTEDGELFSASLFFPVEWDQEHGFVLEFDLDVPAAQTQDLASLLGKVKFRTQPALESQIKAFERAHGLTLPPLFTQFLRLHNGGVPEPNHFTRKLHGQTDPFEINAFYRLGANETSMSLDAAAKRMSDLSLAESLLPIARISDLQGISMAEFVLVLSGGRAGRVLLCDAETLAYAAEDPSHLSELMTFSIAKDLFALFSRLKAKPTEDLPRWLQLIRNGDSHGLVGWIQEGGKMSERFKEYGHYFPQSVGEYLLTEAPVEMIEDLVEQRHITPKQLKAPEWMTYSASTPARLCELIKSLPQPIWNRLLASPLVWQDPEVREILAARNFDFNASVNQEGMSPLHLVVQLGDQEATRWLMAQGADPHKADRFGRDAFVWAESEPGCHCLTILEGKK